MNIFYLSHDVEECAKWHVDRHCVKMILETAQLLSTTHWLLGQEAPYKATHINHPVSKWTRHSLSNYKWLANLGLSLVREYSFRYEKKHKTLPALEWLQKNQPCIEDIGFTKPALAMPDEFKDDDPIIAYRIFYNIGKKHLHKWKKREVPLWIIH